MLSGGPASVYEPGAPAFPTELLDLEIPMLGICYGMQAMVQALGGRVEGAEPASSGAPSWPSATAAGACSAGCPRSRAAG